MLEFKNNFIILKLQHVMSNMYVEYDTAETAKKMCSVYNYGVLLSIK